MQANLQGIPATMLIPLWAKATETSKPEPIIRDDKACEIVSSLDFDFSMFEKSWLSQLGVSIRTMLLDNAARNFVQNNPGSIIVNLGAGLDTRPERLQTESMHCWYDVDLPEAIDLRRRYFKENERNRFISKSMFDFSWMDAIEREERPVLFIAEGLLMYFKEDKLKPLFSEMAARFSGAEMLFEMLAPMLVGNSKKHDSVHKLDSSATFEWGLKNSREMESWDQHIEFITEWDYYDYEKKRWKWFGVLGRMPFVRPRLSNRIVRLRFC